MCPLMWDDDPDPLEWQPHPTAFGRLRDAGVAVSVVSKREFERSGLTVAANRGAEFVGADRVGERIAAAVSRSGQSPSLTYLYDADLDWTGHRYGVASLPWLQQLAMIDAEAEQLREALPRETRLMVVADHGMVDSPPESRIDVDEHLELRDGVVLLGGEARFRHLYCDARGRRRRGRDLAAGARGVARRGADPQRRDRPRAGSARCRPSVLPRLGDVLVACRGDTGVFSSVDFGYETTLVGLHGSLTPDEMMIPVLVD